MKTKKENLHRHKWEMSYSDCPRCGSEMYFECECGEVRMEAEAHKLWNKQRLAEK